MRNTFSCSSSPLSVKLTTRPSGSIKIMRGIVVTPSSLALGDAHPKRSDACFQ